MLASLPCEEVLVELNFPDPDDELIDLLNFPEPVLGQLPPAEITFPSFGFRNVESFFGNFVFADVVSLFRIWRISCKCEKKLP